MFCPLVTQITQGIFILTLPVKSAMDNGITNNDWAEWNRTHRNDRKTSSGVSYSHHLAETHKKLTAHAKSKGKSLEDLAKHHGFENGHSMVHTAAAAKAEGYADLGHAMKKLGATSMRELAYRMGTSAKSLVHNFADLTLPVKPATQAVLNDFSPEAREAALEARERNSKMDETWKRVREKQARGGGVAGQIENDKKNSASRANAASDRADKLEGSGRFDQHSKLHQKAAEAHEAAAKMHGGDKGKKHADLANIHRKASQQIATSGKAHQASDKADAMEGTSNKSKHAQLHKQASDLHRKAAEAYGKSETGQRHAALAKEHGEISSKLAANELTDNLTLEEFTTINRNISTAGYREQMHEGRKHVVVPMTMIVPGVLPGSKGRLHYPAEEVGKDPTTWNGMPITYYHPTRDGKNVSARDPGVLEAQGIGRVYGANYNNKLRAEAWIDVDKADRLDPKILENVRKGRPVEISTGLFTDNEPAAAGSVDHKGRPYDAVARNHRPDHLAILPDQRGACSVSDGCGLGVNGLKDQAGKGSGLKHGPAEIKAGIKRIAKQKGLTLPASYQTNDTSCSLMPPKGKKMKKKPEVVESDTTDNAMAVKDAQKGATRLSKHAMEMSKTSNDYESMIKPHAEAAYAASKSKDHAAAAVHHIKAVGAHLDGAADCSVMNMRFVDEPVDNDDDEDEPVNDSEEHGTHIAAAQAHVHAALSHYDVARLVQKSEADSAEEDALGSTEDDDDAEETTEQEGGKPRKLTDNAEEDDEEEVDAPVDGVANKEGCGCGATANTGCTCSKVENSNLNGEKMKTYEEWLAEAPPQGQEILANAERVLTREKAAIVDELVKNSKDETVKKARTELLMNKSVSELEMIRDTVKDATPVANTAQQPKMVFGGVNMRPVPADTVNNEENDVDMMRPRQIDFAQLSKENRNNGRAVAHN